METQLNVLIVEDSADDAELAVAALERGEFVINYRRVETADEMNEALALGGWDIVICDYRLPRFSAEHALRIIQESEHDLPFIIISGVVQAEDVVALLKCGAHDFIGKEELARLVPAVQRELRESKEHKQRKQAEQRLSILSVAVEQSPVSVVITDKEGVIEYVNPKFEEVTGYDFSDAVGRNIDFTLMDKKGDSTLDELWDTVKDGEDWVGEFCNKRKDGQLFWEYAKVSALKDESKKITHFVAVKEDITVRRSYEEQLLRQAHYDDLTGLPNRVLMTDRLDVAIRMALRSRERAALFCIDLDRFKNVNDLLGHVVGDNLIKEAARRLATCIRDCDTLARMGGDEFVIILPQVDNDSIIKNIANRVIEVFATPFTIGGLDHYVTASVGIALFPEDGLDHLILLRNADLAMYKAKDFGRNCYQFFTEDINQQLQLRVEREAQLRNAVERNELMLDYQPIIDLKTNETIAVEALIRWSQSEDFVCMPLDFIPLAEDVGLIHEIGDWVIATACREFASLLKETGQSLRLAINVSAKQLHVKGFSDFVREQLLASKLQPQDIELEITESVLIDDIPETHVNLQALVDLGVSLSIDDFGTGYSSLGYLQKYPFHTLKIDRGFVKDAAHDEDSARLVETIIAMAHGLHLKVIAEGVESHEQLSFLSPRCCDQAQGYYFSPPMPMSKVITEFSGCSNQRAGKPSDQKQGHVANKKVVGPEL